MIRIKFNSKSFNLLQILSTSYSDYNVTDIQQNTQTRTQKKKNSHQKLGRGREWDFIFASNFQPWLGRLRHANISLFRNIHYHMKWSSIHRTFILLLGQLKVDSLNFSDSHSTQAPDCTSQFHFGRHFLSPLLSAQLMTREILCGSRW